MAEIETLTEVEREFIAALPEHLGGIQLRKTLSIIDAQAAELETQRDMVRTLLDDVNRKVDLIAERDAELERLRARLIDREEKFVGQRAELIAANRALARLGVWADTYGAALVPSGGDADTYGDGVRACKGQVKALIAGKTAAPALSMPHLADALADVKSGASTAPAAPEPPKTQIIDLFEALKKSLEEASREGKL